MIIIDTNIILRYLLNDNKELNKKATDMIDNNDILIPNEVIVEATYVLFKIYSISREEINNIIQELLKLENIYFYNKDTVKLAFETYSDTKLDMVDCMLYAYNKNQEYEVESFDKELMKLINV